MTTLPISDPRKPVFFHAVEYIYGARVEGDVIEFGVKDGDSAGIILAAMLMIEAVERDYPKDRKLWLCDSFEGFPASSSEIDRQSYMVKSGVWGPGQSAGCSAAALRGQLEESPRHGQRCEIVEGWYKNTVGTFAASQRKYALIHADCDLYESTMDALGPLFANGCVAEGAMILFDDWNANAARRQEGQRYAWLQLRNEYRIEASDEGGYGAYSHKFIVHGYRS